MQFQSEKEFKILVDMILEYRGICKGKYEMYKDGPKEFLMYNLMPQYYLSNETIWEMPFEDVPLYINDKWPLVSIGARWRLKVGR